MKVHPLITEAANKASSYTIRPTERGYAVWAFQPWNNTHSGWRIYHIAQTHDDARDNILERLDLEPEKPKPPVIYATVTYIVDPGDFWEWG